MESQKSFSVFDWSMNAIMILVALLKLVVEQGGERISISTGTDNVTIFHAQEQIQSTFSDDENQTKRTRNCVEFKLDGNHYLVEFVNTGSIYTQDCGRISCKISRNGHAVEFSQGWVKGLAEYKPLSNDQAQDTAEAFFELIKEYGRP